MINSRDGLFLPEVICEMEERCTSISSANSEGVSQEYSITFEILSFKLIKISFYYITNVKHKFTNAKYKCK
jgi:hypothetical protein